MPARCDEPAGAVGSDIFTCRYCECRTDLDCARAHEEGIFACFNKEEGEDQDCRCHEVQCRCGRGDCPEEDKVCDCDRLVCVTEKCEVDDDCVDAHKYCRADLKKCVCCDDVSTGTCDEDCCRDTGDCREWFGPTYICNKDHRCLEEPCTGDADCSGTLGHSCNMDTNTCARTPCERDTDCPRRTDIQPLPTGIFYCDFDAGECKQGCREDTDCPANRRCTEEHRCERDVCTAPADCDLGRWCNHESADLPDDAPEDAGICEPGCDEPRDCPANQPCRLDAHVCGCRGDPDCAIINPEWVCEEGGVCEEPCLAHDGCLLTEACFEGHCIEGACRNDEYERNDDCGTAAVLELECEEEEQCTGAFDVRLCAEPPLRPDMPVDLADWWLVNLEEGDELEIEVVWPLVDSDGDGFGDTPGVCDLGEANLSVRMWRTLRDPCDATEWPPGGWELTPPELNGPCILTAETNVAAPQPGAYYLSVENLAFTTVDYHLSVTHHRTVDCHPDGWEPNDGWNVADEVFVTADLFDCGNFLRNGGFMGRPEEFEGPMYCRDDSDWYVLHLREEDRVQVTGTYDPRLGELRAQFFPPLAMVGQDQMFPVRDVGGEDGQFVLIEDGSNVVAEGEYLLQISAPNALWANPAVPMETAYTLGVACEGPRPPCIDDPFEDNDRPDVAHCIHPAGCGNSCNQGELRFEWPPADEPDVAQLHLCEAGGAATGKDEDWYRIDVNAGATISVLTENQLGEAGNWNIELELLQVDGIGRHILAASRAARAINEVVERNLAAGTYYIRVLHPPNAPDRTVPYRMSARVACTPPECNEDNYEENDTLAQARTLQVDSAPEGEAQFACFPLNDAHLALCRPGAGQQHEERDYFKLDLTDMLLERMDVQVRCVDPDGGVLHLDIRTDNGEPDGRYACPENVLYDGECRDDIRLNPDEPCAGGPAQWQTAVLNFPRAEWHYLKVFGSNDPQNEYDLCIRLIEDVCDIEDEFEDNDVCGEARPVLLNQHDPVVGAICPHDEDWWSFRTPGAGWIRVQTQFGEAADLDIQLTDKDCSTRQPLAQDLTLSNMPCLVVENQPEDDYFVRIWGADPMSEAGYDLWVDWSDERMVCP